MTYIPQMQGRAKHLSLLFTLTGFVLAMISEIFPYKSIFQLHADHDQPQRDQLEDGFIRKNPSSS